MKKEAEIKNVTLNSLDKKIDHLGDKLDKRIDNLAKTVEDLAHATAKGFANTATKQDLKNVGERMEHVEERMGKMENKFEKLSTDVNNSIEQFVGNVRGDYDVLTSRVKRLEIAVFKR